MRGSDLSHYRFSIKISCGIYLKRGSWIMGNKGVTLWKGDGEQKDVGVMDGQVENF